MNFWDGLYTDFTEMSGDSCAALAQVVPVFLIALIAERLRPAKPTKGWPLSLLSMFATAVLGISIAVLEIALLLGIEIDGYRGVDARFYWILAIGIVLMTVGRWALPSIAASGTSFGEATAKALMRRKKRARMQRKSSGTGAADARHD